MADRRFTSITTSLVEAFKAKRQQDTIVIHKARTGASPERGHLADLSRSRRKPVARAPRSTGSSRSFGRIFYVGAGSSMKGSGPQAKRCDMLREANARRGFFERDQFEAGSRHICRRPSSR